MLTVLTLLKMKPSPNGEQHGERPFWREFGHRYLNRWIGNMNQYIPDPKQMLVMTDAPEIIPHPAEARPLDKTIDAPGFWSKLNMFRPEVSEGKTLYCDLDNVIAGPLDELCALTPDPLIMLDDRRVPGLPNGSLVLFDAEQCRGIWDRYAAHPRTFEKSYVAYGDDYSRAYDQAFIADCVNGMFQRYQPPFFQEMLPDGYILNARSELPNVADWKSARVIFGCGGGAEGKPHLSTHPGFALR